MAGDVAILLDGGLMDIAIVGAGTVGTAVGIAWARSGHRVVGLTGRQATVGRAATWLPGVPVLPLADAVTGADVVAIGVPDDAHGNLRTFDFNTNRLVPEFGVTQGMYQTDHNNWAPRFGFAYSPFKVRGRQTVLRGGYGIFYNASPLQIYTVLGNNPPASLTEAFNIANGQRLTLANGFPGSGSTPPFPALLAISDDFRPGYVQSWAFTVQQELMRNTVFEIGYVGSKSTGLDQTVALNMPTPGPGTRRSTSRCSAIARSITTAGWRRRPR
jgi:hypothetical protein